MIIEFAGLPCTGKTTLSQKLSNELKIPLKKQSTLKNNLFKMGLFLITFPVASVHIAISILRSEPTPKWYKIRLFKGVMPAYVLNVPKQHFLLDEGLLQRFLAMSPTSAFKKHRAYINHIATRYHLFVVCYIPEEIRKERFLDRKKIPRSNMLTDQQRKQWEGDVKQNAEYLKKMVSNNSRMILLNTTDFDHALINLKDHLKLRGVI